MHVISETMIWRVSLARIEQVVSAHLGPGRVPGNAARPCFSRQISMYLAKHVGHWSLSQIGRFYNGRHHTTVLHAVEKIENLRQLDDSVDALLEVLSGELAAGTHDAPPQVSALTRSQLIETVATRVIERLTGIRTEIADADHPEHVPQLSEYACGGGHVTAIDLWAEKNPNISDSEPVHAFVQNAVGEDRHQPGTGQKVYLLDSEIV